jgi:ribonuclease-3
MPFSSATGDRIRYRFSDERLLDQALTHRSASRRHNERLEFLGDAVLNFLVAEALYQRMPGAREGELTRWRANLVRRQTLATLARGLALGRHLKLGGGEIKTRGAERDSILADAFEAVIGAVYLDGGLEACRAMVLQLFAPHFLPAPEEKSVKDPKTRLQEAVQSRNLPLPTYAVLRVEGAAHEQRFTVTCRVSGVVKAVQGFGSSRRRAEQDAASKTLALLEHG